MLTEKAGHVGRKRKTNNIDINESKNHSNNQNNHQSNMDVTSITVDSNTVSNSTLTQNSQGSRLKLVEPHQKGKNPFGRGRGQ